MAGITQKKQKCLPFIAVPFTLQESHFQEQWPTIFQISERN